MSWLAPLGFLGLVGIVALIIIYVIKPNYKQKFVSSTYVWRLSLKYRKNRLPISRLQNILQFLCQLLILTLCALLLAQPVIALTLRGDANEKVIVIDASAGMRASDGAQTRFERAVREAKSLAEQTVEQGGLVSVILADDTPSLSVQRVANAAEIGAALDALLSDGGACTFGSADIEGAMALAEEVLRSNSEAQVHLFTATDYIEKNGITVHNVAKEGEWNVAVLNAAAAMDRNNHYEISVDLGCYGMTEMVSVYCRVHGANGKTEERAPAQRSEFFDPTEQEKTVVFTTDDFGGEPLYSFDYLEVFVSVEDSFADDNFFFLYGGKKPTIRVQYASSSPNNYFGGVVRTIRENMKNKWHIDYVELKADETPATQGFDFYIFEHAMPEVLPTDGLVLLVDPTSEPDGAGLQLGQSVSVNSSSTLASGTPHDLTKYVDSSRITIAKYRQILASDGYEELAYYNGNPMILVKEEQQAKVVVWAFDLNYSNVIAMPDFSFLIYNMFNHFIPSTLTANAFEIGDTITLKPRGTELKVTGNGEEYAFGSTAAQMSATRPGTYTVTQKPMQGDAYIIESFFVKIPATESNITRQLDALPVIDVDAKVEFDNLDLLIYFAAALVALMFVEWWLQTKKSF